MNAWAGTGLRERPVTIADLLDDVSLFAYGGKGESGADNVRMSSPVTDRISLKIQSLMAQHRPYALRQLLHNKAAQLGAAMYQDPLTGDLIKTSAYLREVCRGPAAPETQDQQYSVNVEPAELGYRFIGASRPPDKGEKEGSHLDVRSTAGPFCRECDHMRERHCPHHVTDTLLNAASGDVVPHDVERMWHVPTPPRGLQSSDARRSGPEGKPTQPTADEQAYWTTADMEKLLSEKERKLKKKSKQRALYHSLTNLQHQLPCHPKICGCTLKCVACPFVTTVEAQRLASVLGIPTSREEIIKLATMKCCSTQNTLVDGTGNDDTPNASGSKSASTVQVAPACSSELAPSMASMQSPPMESLVSSTDRDSLGSGETQSTSTFSSTRSLSDESLTEAPSAASTCTSTSSMSDPDTDADTASGSFSLMPRYDIFSNADGPLRHLAGTPRTQ